MSSRTKLVDLEWLESNFPCMQACPVHTQAGRYVSLIAQGRYEEAYRYARAPNPFASICGRVCGHPCEPACRRGQFDLPISIRALKRFSLSAGIREEIYGSGQVATSPSVSGSAWLNPKMKLRASVSRAIGLTKQDVEIKVLMYEQHMPIIRDLFRDLNPAFADTVIQTGSPNTMLQVKECLDRGGMVGILTDRLVKLDQTTSCTFFGKLARFPAGTMWLASILQVPVILFFGIYRGDNRYEVHFELFAEEVTIDRRHRDQEVQQWTQRYVDRLEHHCRLAADNWFNFYDFWEEHQ